MIEIERFTYLFSLFSCCRFAEYVTALLKYVPLAQRYYFSCLKTILLLYFGVPIAVAVAFVQTSDLHEI